MNLKKLVIQSGRAAILGVILNSYLISSANSEPIQGRFSHNPETEAFDVLKRMKNERDGSKFFLDFARELNEYGEKMDEFNDWLKRYIGQNYDKPLY